jgi:hypothetical protein
MAVIRTEIRMTVPSGDVDAVRNALSELGTDAYGVAVNRPDSSGTSETTELNLSFAGDVQEAARQALEPFPSVTYTFELKDVS